MSSFSLFHRFRMTWNREFLLSFKGIFFLVFFFIFWRYFHYESFVFQLKPPSVLCNLVLINFTLLVSITRWNLKSFNFTLYCSYVSKKYFFQKKKVKRHISHKWMQLFAVKTYKNRKLMKKKNVKFIGIFVKINAIYWIVCDCVWYFQSFLYYVLSLVCFQNVQIFYLVPREKNGLFFA